MSYSGAYVPSKKALYTTRIDTGNAPKAFSERTNLKDNDHCINPWEYQRDQYGRNADPYSLKRDQGTCNNFDPNYSLQAILVRENNNDRPYIDFDQGARHMYDTMGLGRDLQGPESGVGDRSGGWWRRTGMNRNPEASKFQPPVHFAPDSAHGAKSLSSLYRSQYTA
jgi:hypothetical protein